MAQWCNVTAGLKPGEHTVIELNGYSILLVNIAGDFYAVENICPHDRGELSGGTIQTTTETKTVTCPRHGACFDLQTGKVLKPPAFEDIARFAVRIHDGQLQIYDEPAD